MLLYFDAVGGVDVDPAERRLARRTFAEDVQRTAAAVRAGGEGDRGGVRPDDEAVRVIERRRGVERRAADDIAVRRSGRERALVDRIERREIAAAEAVIGAQELRLGLAIDIAHLIGEI